MEQPWMPALGAAFCFGAALVVTQRGLAHLPPRRGALISIPCSALVLWAVAPFRIDIAAVDLRALAIFAAVGLFFPIAVTLLTFESNRRLGPNTAAALGNMAPLFAVLAALLLLGEVPRPLQLLGIAVVVAGVLMLSPRGAFGDSPARWVLLLPLAAAAIRGVIQPVTKLGLQSWPDPLVAVLVGYTVSAGALFLLFGREEAVMLRGVDPRGAAWFGAVGLCNALAVLLMYAALARGPVAVVSPLIATYPLATLALSPLLLGRSGIGWRTVLGVAIAVGGVLLLLLG